MGGLDGWYRWAATGRIGGMLEGVRVGPGTTWVHTRTYTHTLVTMMAATHSKHTHHDSLSDM